MEIIEYKNTFDESMILIIDQDANWAKSMPKAEYDRQQAEQSTPLILNGSEENNE
jgi:hypothetical protein